MLQKLTDALHSRKIASLTLLLLIISAIPLTVFVAQRQQNIKQKAAEKETQTEVIAHLKSIPAEFKPQEEITTIEALTKTRRSEKKINNKKLKSVPGEILVKFKSGRSEKRKETIRKTYGIKKKKEITSVGLEKTEVSPQERDKTIKALKKDPEVEYAEPNFIYKLSQTTIIPNDPFFNNLWGMNNTGQNGGKLGADISAHKAWSIITDADNIKVAVVDTGIDYTHPDLANNIWVNTQEIADNGIDDDNNGYVDDIRGWDFNICDYYDQSYNCIAPKSEDNDPMDDYGHGTHVAGTIGAVGNNTIGVTGVNWKTKLMPLKIFNSQGITTSDQIANAIHYATIMGVKVINTSFGGYSYSQTEYDKFSEANDTGILVAASAGNDSNDNDEFPSYPGGYNLPNFISVAAIDNKDNLAFFSNYGIRSVHLAAPGVSIYSTLPANRYKYLSGTSMAAPHVAGAIALIWSKYPSDSAATIKERVLSGIDYNPNLTTKLETGGRLNVYNSLIPDNFAYSPQQLNITAVPQEITLARTIRLSNFTNTSFNWTANTAATWLNLSKTAGTVNSASFDKISFTTNSDLAVGQYTTNLNFNLTGSQTAQFSIPITLTIIPEKVLYVDAANTGTADGSKDHPFKTINQALVQATDYTRIFVNPGIYQEAIEITKNFITLEGANNISTIVKNPINNNPITLFPPTGKTQGIIIKNFTIQVDQSLTAIIIDSQQNLTIQDNKIIQACQTCDGVGIQASITTDSIFKGNYIKGFGTGINFYAFNNYRNKIEQNYIVGSKRAGVYSLSFASEQLEITDNIFANNFWGVINYLDQKNKYSQNFFIQNNDGLIDIPMSGGNSIYNNSFIENKTYQVYVDKTENWLDPTNNMGNYWSNYDEASEGANDNNNDGVIDTSYTINDLNIDARPYKYTMGRGSANPSILANPIILYPGDQFILKTNNSFPPATSSNKILINWKTINENQANIIQWSTNEITGELNTNTIPGIYKVWLKTPINDLPIDIGVYLAVVTKEDVATLPPTTLPSPQPTHTPSPTPTSIPVCNACTADFNRDGGVDIVDFSRFVKCFDKPASECPTVKTNNNNVVDIEDFSCLKTFFGKQCISPTP